MQRISSKQTEMREEKKSEKNTNPSKDHSLYGIQGLKLITFKWLSITWAKCEITVSHMYVLWVLWLSSTDTNNNNNTTKKIVQKDRRGKKKNLEPKMQKGITFNLLPKHTRCVVGLARTIRPSWPSTEQTIFQTAYWLPSLHLSIHTTQLFVLKMLLIVRNVTF